MPTKPTNQTVYPSMTRNDNVRAFATLVARAAIKEGGNPQNQALVEPDVKQYPVDTETSVMHNKSEMHLITHLSQSAPEVSR